MNSFSFVAQLEGVLDHFNTRRGRKEFYGHHVKSGGDVEKLLLVQIDQGNFGELALLPLMDRGRRSPKVPSRPSFHFNKNQGIFIPGDDVDLSQGTFEVSLQDLVAQRLELTDGQFFTLFAEGESLLSHRRGS